MIPALALAITLMLADAPAPDNGGGEPLPPGAPTDSYELSAWCYGALDEYLAIYEKVKPDLRDIDHMFGTSVVEDEPYHSDMAAARVELKMIANSVTQAEKASPRPISDQGLAAIKQGRAIWSIAEGRKTRELARAWMLWALPDRCDSNAKELTQRSILFGKALNYNNQAPAPPASDQAAPAASPADAAAPPPAAAEPSAQASPTTDTNVPADTALDTGGAPAAPAPTPSAPDAAPRDPAIPPYPTAPPAGDQPAQAPSPRP
jgi:hypothetical protein